MVDSVKLIESALAGSGDVMFSWDLASDRIFWVGDVANMFGDAAAEELTVGGAYNDRIFPDDLKERLGCLSKHFAKHEPFECEYRVRTDANGFCWIHERASAEFSEDGKPVRLGGVLRIVTGRKQHEMLLEQRANYDDLTGLFNKSRLRESLEHTLAYAIRYDATGGFLAIGIDKMSMLNDAYGHEIADAVIVNVAQRLESCLRQTDSIGRLGGDTFGVVLPNCDELGIAAAAEKVLHVMREDPIETTAGPIHVTVSVGAIGFPNMIQTPHDLMASAESAMRDAKRLGRNCFAYFEITEEQRQKQREYMVMGEQLLKAIQEKRVVFAYQPVVNSKTGEIAYYETLVRMIDEDGEVVSAGVFVPVAERLGLMRQLDRRTLDMALQDLARDPDVRLALNISGLTASDRSWLRVLVNFMKDKPDLAKRLIIEITETAALEDFEDSALFVAAVRDLGCKVALDDFGSGYTTFRHLKSLTVDVVKIDGSFVMNVSDNPDNLLFIRSLLNLAGGFGVDTVAECVETEEDANLLIREGVNFLQGYFYGRPELGPVGRGSMITRAGGAAVNVEAKGSIAAGE